MRRSLLNQKVTLKDALIQEQEQILPMEPFKESNVLASVTLIAIGVVIGMLLLAGVRACDPDMKPVAIQQNCVSCHSEQMSMTIYFKNNGSKTPEEMAYAVLQTKSPKLLAAMAVVESDGNPAIRNRGYKKRHHGAFQVNQAIHGEVPTNPADQAKQAERILEELTDKYPIKTALSIYGGDSTNGYQKKILAELNKVP